jgi:MFS family permease
MNLVISAAVLTGSAIGFGVVFGKWSDWYDRTPKKAGATCAVCVVASVTAFVLLILSIPPWG